MKYLTLLIILFAPIPLYAQMEEEFTDGDFTNNPVWTASNNGLDFLVVDGKLRSNSGVVNNSFSISTPNTLADNVLWECWLNLQFSTSGSNYVDIYVMSDKSDLKSTMINGYFIRVGNTDDEVSLYRRSGTISTITKLIDGVNGSLGTANNTVKIRLRRENTGKFTLERDVVSSGSTYFTEGTAIDLTHTRPSYFGFLVLQSTSSFFLKHFIDSIKINPIVSDLNPPIVNTVSSIDSNIIEITFNEEMDSVSTKMVSNYAISIPSVQILKVLSTSSPAKYRLVLVSPLNSGTYLVTASNVKDKSGNVVGTNNSGSFSYVKPYLAKFGDVVINEIFADPSPQVDLPSVEFAELRNNTDKTLSLKNWKFVDTGSSTTFGEISIAPYSHLIICAKADTAEYKAYGKVSGLSPWPSLNNTGELIKLIGPENQPVDSLHYSDTWYRNTVKKQGGWSLERKDPGIKCTGPLNWFASTDSTGGTPGRENSGFVRGFDSLELRADSLRVLSDTTIRIYFNKHLNSSTITLENFSLLPKTAKTKKIIAENDFREVLVTFERKFILDTQYNLTIVNLKDCYGVTLTNITKPSFKISSPPAIIEKADTAKIIITEIFADPSPEIHLPLVEFIEIFNPSKDTVDLDKWTLNDPATKATIKGQKILPNQYLILCPAADTSYYQVFGKTIGLNPWPSLNNSSDQVTLKSFKNRVVDSVAYNDSWYRSNSKKTGGWSIERIDLKSICTDYLNWTASIDSMGGSPGKMNSANISEYDGIALRSDSLKLLSDTTIKLYFNKYLNSALLQAENFELIPTNLLKKISSDQLNREVVLTFSKPFKSGTDYELLLHRLKDCSGNSLATPTPIKFKTSMPVPPVTEKADTARIIISEIFADPSPEVGLPLVEFIEIFNPSKDTVDLDKWTLNDPATKATISGQKILPNQYLILCPAADTSNYQVFGKTIGLNPWPSLNNSSDQVTLKSFKNRVVDSVAYNDSWYRSNSKKTGGWSMERIDLKSICTDYLNWTASIDSMGGSPGKMNSANISEYDGIALRTDSLKLLSDTTIKLYFNKYLNSALLQAENFELIPTNLLKKISSDQLNREVVLTFSKPFKSGTDYELLLHRLKDCSGNSLATPTPIKFKTSMPVPPVTEKADTARIIISEIFADPSPEVGLPLVEFIEIFNPSKDTVDLDKWTLNDTATKATISGQKILPNQYLILCPAADTSNYQVFGKTIGLNPWPSLNNSSDQVTLKSFKNRVVDSVAYNDSWYRSNSKKTGGWSIERIDLKSICTDYLNWTASIDSMGGSPGKMNSANISEYDGIALRTDSLKLLSDTTIKLYFNKYLNSALLQAENFELIPTNLLKKISSDQLNREVVLTFSKPFKSGTDYELLLHRLKDCSGNSLATPTPIKFKTSMPVPPVTEKADTARIIITEIFADPSPEIHLPLVEFIEIFNPSKDTVDLDKWTLNDPATKATISGQKILPNQYLILCPAADTSNYQVFGKTIGLNPWPSLNNSSDQVTLKSFKNRVVDSVAYNDSWYRSNSKKTGGWSMERIDLKSICTDYLNWTASIDSMGGSPGKMNSANISEYDGIALRTDSLKLLSDTTIKLYFNKYLNSALLQAENFELIPTNLLKKISSDQLNREVVLTFSKPFKSGTDYELLLHRLKDCSGNSLATPTPIKFKTSMPVPPVTEKADTARIIISEIFADPSPEVGLPLVEFIELYNPGAIAVDLTKWTLNDQTTKSSISATSIAPGEFLIICPAADTLIFKAFGKTKGLSPWPSLGNVNDQITLKSFKQRLVDSVSYSDSWYKNKMKKSGGWSLEKTDLLNNSCNGFYTWTSSVDQDGGTPGRRNSTQKVVNGLIKIDSVSRVSDEAIVVHLNSIADTSKIKAKFFTIDNEIGNAVEGIFEEDFLKLKLKFQRKLQEGVLYTLSTDSIYNCSGKRSPAPLSQYSFVIPTIPEVDYPILITEILADPTPQVGLPEAEFVELYNPTDKTVSLKGMYYGNETTKYKLTSGEIKGQSYLILCSTKDTTQFTGFGRTLGLPLWPTITNEKGALILENNKGRVIQKVAYSQGWYRENDKKTGGYSLEMINPASICIGAPNWSASKDPSGGTPGKANSVLETQALQPLKLSEAELTDSVSLLLRFNNTLDSLSASKPANYNINNGVGTPESVLFSSSGFQEIILKFKAPPARGHTYRIEVEGIADCSGTIIQPGMNSREFILTEKIEKSKILISEILFNPNKAGVDFLEIYNNSNHTLDLQELSIATITNDTVNNPKRISAKQMLFEPGKYLAITTDPQIIKKEYKTEKPETILKALLPSFNDDKGTVVLLGTNTKIDELNFSEKMHFQLLKGFEGVSLERSSFSQETNAAGNFRSATAASGFATPGYQNSQFSSQAVGNEEFALTSRTFSPDNDGFEDVLQVSYRLESPGMVANVKIFNDKGTIVKHILKNSTLNSDGMFTWDGLNEFNHLSNAGIYIVYAEIFDTKGKVKMFRKSFALATKL